ncbi:hypothetical protein DEEACLCL_00158 [Salmonella phage CRW-SP2]|nr:hypothetical protein DEEACLCL_00158 [Salmonella phage CRW-SP2]
MTLEELEKLDETEILRGYEQSRRGYSLSGYESKAFIHGWRNGQCDFHGVPTTPEQQELAREYVAKHKNRAILNN